MFDWFPDLQQVCAVSHVVSCMPNPVLWGKTAKLRWRHSLRLHRSWTTAWKALCPPACLSAGGRRPGFPPSWRNGGRAGLELVAHPAVEVGEIVLCLWNCSPIMTCDLFCKSLCQCQSVHLNRWGLLILKQGKDWYYADLIISLNLQPRLLDRPKDWNVKEIIFWCDLLCKEESLVQEE